MADYDELVAAGQTKSTAILRVNEQLKAVVEALRALPYADYLRTDHWFDLRDSALARNPYCHLCGIDERLHVHHRTYAGRGRERPEDLVVLCSDCHAAVHGRLPDQPPPGPPEPPRLEDIAKNWSRRRF